MVIISNGNGYRTRTYPLSEATDAILIQTLIVAIKCCYCCCFFVCSGPECLVWLWGMCIACDDHPYRTGWKCEHAWQTIVSGWISAFNRPVCFSRHFSVSYNCVNYCQTRNGDDVHHIVAESRICIRYFGSEWEFIEGTDYAAEH